MHHSLVLDVHVGMLLEVSVFLRYLWDFCGVVIWGPCMCNCLGVGGCNVSDWLLLIRGAWLLLLLSVGGEGGG